MPRVLVTTQPAGAADAPVLLDETVQSSHLEDDHSAAQLIERIAWAVSDAAEVEDEQPARHGGRLRRGAVRGGSSGR